MGATARRSPRRQPKRARASARAEHDAIVSNRAEPMLGEVLRRARKHRGYSLRDVEERTGILNAHLSQIERGQIRRPDPSLLWRLSELYLLDYGALAHWAGHAGEPGDSTAQLAAAVRMLGDLEVDQIAEVLRVIDRLRRERDRDAHADGAVQG